MRSLNASLNLPLPGMESGSRAAVAVPDALEALGRIVEGLWVKSPSDAPGEERLDRAKTDGIRILFSILARCADREPGPNPSEWRKALAEQVDRGGRIPPPSVAGILDASPLAPLVSPTCPLHPPIDPHSLLLAVDRLSRGTAALGSREWTEFSAIAPRDIGSLYEALRSLTPGGLHIPIDQNRSAPSIQRGTDDRARKASGFYYTPEAIVRHIVRRALEPLRGGRNAGESREPDGDRGERGRSRALHLLDPAMGCGYFLLSAAEMMGDSLRGGDTGDERLRRREIAASSLYGVDKDPVAVELARMALSSWVAGRLTHEVLPELNEALRAGDALVGDPPGRPASADAGLRDARLSDLRLSEGRFFHWAEEFPAIFGASGGPGTGFDAVFGNPPYDNSRGGLEENPDLGALARYARACGHYRIHGAVDLYRLFLQRSFQVCRAGGVVSMIVPRSLLGDRDAAQERKLLLAETEILSIDDFPYDDAQRRVFPSAALATCIVTCRNRGISSGFAMVEWPNGRMQGPARRSTLRRDALERFWPENVPLVSWSESEWAAIDHLSRAEWIGPLSEISEAGIGEANSGYHKPFMVDRDTGSLLVRGSDVSAYFISDEGTHKRWIDRDGFFASLTPFSRERLRWSEARVAKQAVKNINARKRLVAGLTEPGQFLADSTDFFIAKPPYDSRYLLALLNSRSAPEWLFQRISTNNNVNLYQVRHLPAPRVCFTTEREERRRRLDEEWSLMEGVTGCLDPHAAAPGRARGRPRNGTDGHDGFIPSEMEALTGRWIASRAPSSPGLPDLLHDLIVRLAQSMIDLKREVYLALADFPRRAALKHRIRIAEALLDSLVWRMYGLDPAPLFQPIDDASGGMRSSRTP